LACSSFLSCASSNFVNFRSPVEFPDLEGVVAAALKSSHPSASHPLVSAFGSIFEADFCTSFSEFFRVTGFFAAWSSSHPSSSQPSDLCSVFSWFLRVVGLICTSSGSSHPSLPQPFDLDSIFVLGCGSSFSEFFLAMGFMISFFGFGSSHSSPHSSPHLAPGDWVGSSYPNLEADAALEKEEGVDGDETGELLLL